MVIERYYSRLLTKGRTDNPSLSEAASDLAQALAHTTLRDLNG